MPVKTPIPCPLCQSTSYDVVYAPTNATTDPALLYGLAAGVRGTQRLVRCHGCGFLYENPRYSEDIILSGYQAAQGAGYDSQFALRRNTFLATLEKLADDLPPKGARVLDIGSASGAFLEAARAFGYIAVGLEPSRDLMNAARARGLDVVEGTLANHNFEPNSFDMICFWDVLEHVTDPVGALAAARKLLKPGGVVLINYPDIGTWQAKLAGRRFWWITSYHLTHFSPATLGEATRRAGLKLFRLSPYWQALEIGYLFGIAAEMGVPLAGLIGRHLPAAIARTKLHYWASQTTALASIEDQ